ncbi:hypothetical protein GCM10010285_55590 [Streptomyces pseudogriseolus]|uniref:Uncharacterized protein n=1 Tax=Streptomyces pseudogriseolus TaxID=36817 RepID=A0ABQ2TKB9_STREZ|nr:hypothetical protein GCM10010285_55590 [Streptomyces rubiginosus]
MRGGAGGGSTPGAGGTGRIAQFPAPLKGRCPCRLRAVVPLGAARVGAGGTPPAGPRPTPYGRRGAGNCCTPGAGRTGRIAQFPAPLEATGVPGTVARRVQAARGWSRRSSRPWRGAQRIRRPAASATASDGTASSPSSAPDASSR